MSKYFEMLPEEAFQKVGKSMKLYKKGGGGPTQTSVQQSNIPEYAQPYVESMLGAAQQQIFQGNTDAEGNFNITGFNEFTPYSTNMQDYVAGFSPMQQQAFQGAANLQTPGQFGVATGLAGASGYGSLGTAGQAANLGQQATDIGLGGLGYGALGAGYGALGAGAGQNAADIGSLGTSLGLQAARQASRQGSNVANQAMGYGALGAGYGAGAADYGQLGAEAGQQAAGYGAMGAGYGAQAGQAGANFAQQATDPNAVRAYMNPYLESSLAPQIEAMRRQYGITGTQQQSAATGAGAFGGTREALMAAENQRSMNSAIDNAIAQGYNTAFTNAQAQQQFGANLGLQGQQAAMQGAGMGITGQNAAMQGAQTGISGQQAAMQGAQTGLSGLGQALSGYGLGLQGAQTGLSGIGQGISGEQAAMQGAGLGMQGAGMGLQGIGTALQGYGQGQQGLSTALQGYGQAGQAAGQLGQLGTQQLAAEQGILGTQQQYGAMQQQAEQQKIDQAIQNYAMQQQAPMQSLAQMSGLLRGLPLESTTTQSYQAGPGALQSLAGIGTGIAGVASLAKAKGGTVKSYAKGGIASYAGGGDVMSQENAEGIAQGLNADQLQQVQPRTLPDYIRIPLLNQKIQEQQAAQQAMAAQQGIANQESLKQQVLAQAEDLGITGAQSNLPTESMAGGGIVSFAQGGVNAPKFDFTPTDMDYGYLTDIEKRLVNPETGKPYTFEEKAAENRVREAKLGIKDLTESELKLLKEKEDKLGAREDRARGLGLLAASEGIMGSKGPGLGWMGAGLGAYGKSVGPELDKIDALRENYAQQGSLLRSKQMDLKRAMLAGDTADINRIEKDIQAIQTKRGEAANANIAAQDAARLKGIEAEYKYVQDMALADKEGAYNVAAGAASNIGVVQLPASVYNMVEGRNARQATLEKEFYDSAEGQSYQTAKKNQAKGAASPTDLTVIKAGDKYLSDLKAEINKKYAPLIRNQIIQARAHGHPFSPEEEKNMLSGINSTTSKIIEYNADGTRKK